MSSTLWQTAMSTILFRFKKANSPTRLVYFEMWPSWQDLASNVSRLFDIPQEKVGIAFVENRDATMLENERGFQGFYQSLDQSCKEIKFVVQDIRTPDGEFRPRQGLIF